MVRMSALRNMPVILGKVRLGLVQSVSLDEARKRVQALIVSCGIRGKRVILPESVLSIGDGFILAEASRRYHRSDEPSPCPFVRDSAGLLVGLVTDYALDEKTLAGAISAIRQADVLIVGGTSLTVYPAAGLLGYYRGDRLALINRGETPYDDMAGLVLYASLGDVFSQL